MGAGDSLEGKDGLRIGYYDDWMFDQVIDMIVEQYGRDRDAEAELFRRFYEAPFQRDDGIRLVALDGDRVCGFQSYFYWPYMFAGQRLRSFQSGNSLVSADYRGRRIFSRLLNFLEELEDHPQIDLLMGFPVQMSYGSFIRNGWDNPLDLSWYVRPVHPLSALGGRELGPGDWNFDREPESVEVVYPAGTFALSKEEDFSQWRRSYPSLNAEHLYFHHGEGDKTIRFTLKPNRRGRVQELIIGDIVRNSEDPALLVNGVRELVRAARGQRGLTALSVALNRKSADAKLERTFKRRGFFRIRNEIYFIVKPVKQMAEAVDPARWQLFRSDIDTW